MCKFSKPIYRRLLKLYTFRVSLYAHVYILTGGQPKPRGEVHEDLFSQRDYQRFSLKCSPYGDRGGPLALQQLARHFPHFGLGRLATNTRHQDLLPNYKEVRGSKILGEDYKDSASEEKTWSISITSLYMYVSDCNKSSILGRRLKSTSFLKLLYIYFSILAWSF